MFFYRFMFLFLVFLGEKSGWVVCESKYMDNQDIKKTASGMAFFSTRISEFHFSSTSFSSIRCHLNHTDTIDN